MAMSKTIKLVQSVFGLVGCVALFLTSSACCPPPLVMADTAFRAELVATNVPTVMARGEKRPVRVEVRNASETRWHTNGLDPSYKLRSSDDDMYRIYLGNHWLDDASQKIIINDDGRTALPEILNPGDSATILLGISAPKDPGEYILELDLVQENITWFAAKGSPTARYNIKVE